MLVLPLISFVVFMKLNSKVKFGMVLLLSMFAVMFFTYAQKSLQMSMGPSLETATKRINLLSSGASEGGSTLNKDKDPVQFSGFKDVVVFLPNGMFTALFRPLPGDVNNLFGIGASLEGLLMLGLFLRACNRTSLRELKDPFIAFILLFILSWAFVYAFNAQNMGTLMRWRLPIFPVFLGLLLYLGRHRERGKLPAA